MFDVASVEIVEEYEWEPVLPPVLNELVAFPELVKGSSHGCRRSLKGLIYLLPGSRPRHVLDELHQLFFDRHSILLGGIS